MSLCLLLRPGTGKGEGLGRLWEEGTSLSSSCVAPSLAEVPEATAHMLLLLSWMLEEGCPGRPCSPWCAFLSPGVQLQHFGVSLPVGNPWEEEGSSQDQDVQPAPGYHCWDGQQEGVRDPKYPSTPQESRGELIQSHPWDTSVTLPGTCSHFPSARAVLCLAKPCSAEISGGLFSFLSEKNTSFGLIWIEKTIQSL